LANALDTGFRKPTTPGFALLDLVGPAHDTWKLSRCYITKSDGKTFLNVAKIDNWVAGKALARKQLRIQTIKPTVKEPTGNDKLTVNLITHEDGSSKLIGTSSQPAETVFSRSRDSAHLGRGGGMEGGNNNEPTVNNKPTQSKVNLMTHDEDGSSKLIDTSSQHAVSSRSRDSAHLGGGGGMEPRSAKADAEKTLGVDLASGQCAFPENSARKVPAGAVCEVVAFTANALKSDQNPAIFYTCVARANLEPRRAPPASHTHPSRAASPVSARARRWDSGVGGTLRHIALVRMPTAFEGRLFTTFLLRWFVPVSVNGGKTPTEAANSRSAPLALKLFGDATTVESVVSLCDRFIALHNERAGALKKSIKEAGAKNGVDSKADMDTHNDMVKRASDSCGEDDEATNRRSDRAQRCLCVALETLPSGNNAPENRVMRIFVPVGDRGKAFVADIKSAADEARHEDRLKRDLTLLGAARH
jgi:hypothetical protein